MTPAAAPARLTSDSPFRDGLGERRLTTDATGQARELLCIRAELTAVPAFEFALRERVARLAEFRHPYFAATRGVERVTDVESSLGIVSDRVAGVRLSELFVRAAERGLNIEINAALCLIRQIVPAVARLHDACRDVSHGALAPERVVLTPNGRLMVTDYVLGAALEQLRFSQERYWRDLRIALPRSAGLPRVDQRGDVTQIGVIALSLILSRNLREDEYPARIADVVASARVIAPRGGFEPLPVGLRNWLLRALQVDVRQSFATVAEANDELEHVLGDLEYPGLPASVEAFLGRYRDADAPGEFHSELEPVQQSDAETASPSAVLPVEPVKSAAEDPLAAFFSEQLFTEQAAAVEPVASTATETSAVGAAAPGASDVTALFATAALDTPDDPSAPEVVTPLETLLRRPDPVVVETPLPVAITTLASASTSRSTSTSVAPSTAVAPSNVVRLDRLDARFEAGLQSIDDRLAEGTSPDDDTVAVRDLFAGGEPAAARRPAWWMVAAAVVVVGGVAVPLVRSFAAPKTSPAAPSAATSAAATANGTATETSPATSSVTSAAGASAGSAPVAAAMTSGQLSVTTNPAGAEAWLDGKPVGTTPLTLTLDAGSYSLELRGAGAPKTVPVTIAAGGRIEQFIELPVAAPSTTVPGVTGATGTPPAPAVAPTGFLAVRTPIELSVLDSGRLVGTSASGRLPLPTGPHTLTLTNDALGYSVTRQVDIAAGKATSIAIELPNGKVAVNASPWAEVYVDGKALGETPLGDLAIPIGTHELLLRHPDLGERRQPLTVPVSGVVRVSVDLRTP